MIHICWLKNLPWNPQPPYSSVDTAMPCCEAAQAMWKGHAERPCVEFLIDSPSWSLIWQLTSATHTCEKSSDPNLWAWSPNLVTENSNFIMLTVWSQAGQDYGQGTVGMTWLHDFWGLWLGRPSRKEVRQAIIPNIGEKAEGQANEQVCPCLQYYGKKLIMAVLQIFDSALIKIKLLLVKRVF